jgi:hypothetical protein
MLPQMPQQEERRPRTGSPGNANIVLPTRTDLVTVSYDDYLSSLPAEEDLVPYGPEHPEVKEPVIYWNPIDPGSYIKPWPQIGMMHDQNGKIVASNRAEELAWRAKLAQYAGGNPDKWKGNTGDYDFTCDTCHFSTRNAIAWTDHVRYWKHK